MERNPQQNFWQKYTFDLMLLPFATALALTVWAIMGSISPLL